MQLAAINQLLCTELIQPLGKGIDLGGNFCPELADCRPLLCQQGVDELPGHGAGTQFFGMVEIRLYLLGYAIRGEKLCIPALQFA